MDRYGTAGATASTATTGSPSSPLPNAGNRDVGRSRRRHLLEERDELDRQLVRRWNRLGRSNKAMSDGEDDMPVGNDYLPSGGHHRRYRHHYHHNHYNNNNHRYRHHYPTAGDRVSVSDDMGEPLDSMDRRQLEHRGPIGAMYSDSDNDDGGGGGDNTDFDGPMHPSAIGSRPNNNHNNYENNGYYGMESAGGVAPSMGVVDPTFEVNGLVVEEGDDVPIQWKKTRFHFQKTFNLASLAKKKSASLVVNFGNDYKDNKAVQDLLASGAYMGSVRVVGLRLVHSPVSLAVRGESMKNVVPLADSQEYLATVSRPVHGVLSKHTTPNQEGSVLTLRAESRVAPTWLSGYSGWTVANLGRQIKPTLVSGRDEVAANHPIVDLLLEKDMIASEDLDNRESVHLNHEDVEAAKRELIDEELNNPKISDARSLRLVFVRAHGARTSAGSPNWSDKSEIVDDVLSDKNKQSMLSMRQQSPITIMGQWEIEHGHPIDPVNEGDDDDDDTFVGDPDMVSGANAGDEVVMIEEMVV